MLLAGSLPVLVQANGTAGQIYTFSAPISGATEVALSFGDGSIGGTGATFGTLNETLYYDAVAQTLRQVGSVSLSPAEALFPITVGAGWPGTPPYPSATAHLTIGDGTGWLEFDSGTQSGISSGGGESFGWTLNLPVNGPCTVVSGGVTNCGTLSYSYGLSLVTTISAAGATSLDVTEFNVFGANAGLVVGDIGGWDLVNGSSDDTYEYSWDLSSLVATETPEPDGLMFLGLGAAMAALGCGRRDGGLGRGRGSRPARIFHSWLETDERGQRRSAGFQPAVSPTSSRQPVRTRCGSAGGQRVGNPRYSRLEVCAAAHAGLNHEISGLAGLSGSATKASQGVGHNEHQAARFHEP